MQLFNEFTPAVTTPLVNPLLLLLLGAVPNMRGLETHFPPTCHSAATGTLRVDFQGQIVSSAGDGSAPWRAMSGYPVCISGPRSLATSDTFTFTFFWTEEGIEGEAWTWTFLNRGGSGKLNFGVSFFLLKNREKLCTIMTTQTFPHSVISPLLSLLYVGFILYLLCSML